MRVLAVIHSRITALHPDYHAIAIAMGWVALFVFLGKVAGAVKEMAIAYRYGVSAEVDAYLLVLNLLSWPTAVWFSVFGIVLVPLVARTRRDAPAALPRFRAEILGLTFLAGLVLAALAWLPSPYCCMLLGPGYPSGPPV